MQNVFEEGNMADKLKSWHGQDGSQPAGKNRRQATRRVVNTRHQVELVISPEEVINGLITDVNPTGIGVISGEKMTSRGIRDAVVTIRFLSFDDNQAPPEIKAKVVYGNALPSSSKVINSEGSIRIGWRVGLQFIEPATEEEKQRIAELLNSI